jgi:hypothetical protein
MTCTGGSALLLALTIVSAGSSPSRAWFVSGRHRAMLPATADRALQHPPIAASVTRADRVRGPIEFSNPVLGMTGTIEPRAGNVLQMIEIVLGDTDIEAEIGTFELVTVDGVRHAPIAVGGGAQLLFPIDRLPIGREMTQILPTDAAIAVTKNSTDSVTLEATSMATLAFLYEVPQGAAVKILKLPDGSALALDK